MSFAVVFLNDYFSLSASLSPILINFLQASDFFFSPSLLLIQIILRNTLHVKAGYLSLAKTSSKTDRKELICEPFSDYI